MNYSVLCCISCNKLIRDGIYNSQFYPNLFTMLAAFFMLALIIGTLTVIATRQRGLNTKPSPIPLHNAAMVLGIGLGGFIDGIVLHQVFQWHEMLSSKIAATDYVGKSVNMFWDGIFHMFCLIVVFIGIVLLWKAVTDRKALLSGRLVFAGLISGWGLFNLVEGVIDHHLLKLHNVIEYASNHDVANYFFLGFSILLLIVGEGIRISHRSDS